jgi:hypothetical protein
MTGAAITLQPGHRLSPTRRLHRYPPPQLRHVLRRQLLRPVNQARDLQLT